MDLRKAMHCDSLFDELMLVVVSELCTLIGVNKDDIKINSLERLDRQVRFLKLANSANRSDRVILFPKNKTETTLALRFGRRIKEDDGDESYW
jgi:hypothetical protein